MTTLDLLRSFPLVNMSLMTFEEACAIAKATLTDAALRDNGIVAVMAKLRERLAGTEWNSISLADETLRQWQTRPYAGCKKAGAEE